MSIESLEPLGTPIALLTDIDGTIHSHECTTRFATEVWPKCKDHMFLIFLTGRTMADTLDSIRSYELPQPDIIVADVGTSWRRKKTNTEDQHPFLFAVKRFPRNEVVRIMEGFQDLNIQETCSPHRASYNIVGAVNKIMVENALSNLMVDCLWSQDYLDILPQGVNKGTVASHIINCLIPSEAVVILAGNSYNDSHLFIDVRQPCHRVVPNDTDQSLIEELSRSTDCILPEGNGVDGVLTLIQELLSDTTKGG